MLLLFVVSLAFWGAIICVFQGDLPQAMAFCAVGLLACLIGRPS